MSRATGWARLAAGAGILAVLIWRLGTGPFLDGLRSVRGWPLLAAVAITAATTVCSAARWRLIARGLGVELSLPAAVAYYYRSQFLNSALPGGVVGDVDRGLRQGRAAGEVGRGLRAVVWDRAAGQLVQAVLAVLVLLGFASPLRLGPLGSASPLRPALPLLGGWLLVLLLSLGALLVAGLLVGRSTSRLARTVRAVRADLATLGRPAGLIVLVCSVAIVAGHAAIFLIAARTAATPGSPVRLLPLAMLVLVAMTIPLSIGGWGPREGVAAWAFGVAGFGMNQGVEVATVYGVMAFAATLPGAAVLVHGWLRRPADRTQSAEPRLPVGAHG